MKTLRTFAILACLGLAGGCTTLPDGSKALNPDTVKEAQHIAAVICGYVPSVAEVTKLAAAQTGDTNLVSVQAAGSAYGQMVCTWVTAQQGSAMAAATPAK